MLTEKQIESYLKERVKVVKGLCYKFVSPGNDGVPDRICVFPGGYVAFVELKAESGGKLSALQKLQHERLKNVGVHVWVLSTKIAIDAFVEAHNDDF